MLYYNLNNYEDFKSRFGLEKRDNNAIVRKNKILLGHLKNPLLIRYCMRHDDYSLLHISDMANLQKKVMEAVRNSGKDDETLPYKVELIGETYWSAKYKTDDAKGVCEDLNKFSVRYLNIERNRIFKMRAGKFMRELILETRIGKLLSPSVLNWLAGDVFTLQWSTYTYGHTPGIKLHVDNDFGKIYRSQECRGTFNSCMTDRNRHPFYQNSVKAKAAYITDQQGHITARAILFTDVTDQDGKKWRLLERQYSTDDNNVWKRLLIDKLIQGGHIDGYKIVGASCHEANAFVEIDGNSLANKKFKIDCDLDDKDTLSYQDSFKWYCYNQRKAYNYPHNNYTYELDITDLNLYGDEDEENEEDEEEWDEYHQYHCADTTLCHWDGRVIFVDSHNLDDFVWIESKEGYYHISNITLCTKCRKAVLNENAKYSQVTAEFYCCIECMNKAEKEFKQKNWHYSEYDNEWYEDPDEITRIHLWNKQANIYEKKSISSDTLDRLVTDKKAWLFDGEAFDKTNPLNGLPFNYKQSPKETCHEYATVEEAV